MKPPKILNLITSKYKEPSVCEACGNEFICGATLKGCWCMSLKLTDDARAEMKSKYTDCLCQDCLEKYEAKGL